MFKIAHDVCSSDVFRFARELARLEAEGAQLVADEVERMEQEARQERIRGQLRELFYHGPDIIDVLCFARQIFLVPLPCINLTMNHIYLCSSENLVIS